MTEEPTLQTEETRAVLDWHDETLAAHERSSPAARPTVIVVPERDTPGKTAAPCANPTSAAWRQVVLPSPLAPPSSRRLAPTTRTRSTTTVAQRWINARPPDRSNSV